MKKADYKLHTANRNGSALIVVLWVLGLLSLLIGSFAFDARIEARIISYYRKRSKARYIAKSGTELATLFMVKSKNNPKGNSSSSTGEEETLFHEEALRLARGLSIEGYEHEMGDGKFILDIVPEPARRNVNNLGNNSADIEQSLERIFEVGGITEDTGLWPVLIESFLDWTDKDDEPRADGAETQDYYASLTNSYQAKNGPLDTVGELLLVKGYNHTILFGGKLDDDFEGDDEDAVEISGIQDLLTTYGDGKVNVNAAGIRVLMTLPGVDDLIANAIIEEREGSFSEDGVERSPSDIDEDYSFKSVGDFLARIPDLDPGIKRYVTTSSSIYRITSVAEVGGVRKKVWCIARFYGTNLEVLRWREED